MLEQRRDGTRLPTEMGAQIFAPGQRSSVPCIVRDISPAGAKLEIDNGWVLPRSFWLRIDGHTHMYFCMVVWRKDAHMVVDFPSSRDSSWWTRSNEMRGRS